MATKHQGTPKEKLALDTYIKLTRATVTLAGRLSQRGAHGGLTPSQFGTLEALYHLGPMNQTEIGGKLLKTGGNITMVIDNLEKRDLVKRVRDAQDRRRVMIHLTKAGEELIRDLFPSHLAAIVDKLSVLSEQEHELLGGICRKLGLKS